MWCGCTPAIDGKWRKYLLSPIDGYAKLLKAFMSQNRFHYVYIMPIYSIFRLAYHVYVDNCYVVYYRATDVCQISKQVKVK